MKKVVLINHNKKAQFFLLAAVVISVAVLSLTAVNNSVSVNEDFSDLDDYSYEVEREIGAVLDYEIYTLGDGEDASEFVKLVAEDLEDKDSDVDFVVVYTTDDEVTVSNYGDSDVEVINGEIEDIVYCFKRGIRIEEISSCAGYNENCYACEGSCSDDLRNCVGVNVDVTYGKGIEGVWNNGIFTPTSDSSTAASTQTIEQDDIDDDSITVTIDGVSVNIPTDSNKIYFIIGKNSGESSYYSSK